MIQNQINDDTVNRYIYINLYNLNYPFHRKILFKNMKVYNVLNNTKIKIKSQGRWHILVNITLSNFNWQDIFRVCFNTINVNEYKWFQYRIIHRILGVRSKLYQINISEDDTCQLCKE